MSGFGQGVLCVYLIIGAGLACAVARPVWETMVAKTGRSRPVVMFIVLFAFSMTWIVPMLTHAWKHRS